MLLVSIFCLRENLNVIGIHKSKKKDNQLINYGTFIGIIIREINNEESIMIMSEKYDEIYIDNKKNIEDIIDEKQEPLIEKNISLEEKEEISREEFEFQDNITFWILLLSFSNLKLFVLLGANMSTFGFNKLYIIKLVCLCFIYTTKNSFLIIIMIFHILLFILFFYSSLLDGETNLIIVMTNLLFLFRNYIKDAFIFNLIKYNFYKSVIYFSTAEGYSNLLFLFFFIILKN